MTENKIVVIKAKKKAALLNECAKLNSQKKEIDARIKEIKGQLTLAAGSTYTTPQGFGVKISTVDKYSDIDPKELLIALKKQRLGSKFGDCVKVSVPAVTKVLGDKETASLRKLLSSTERWNFI